MCCDIQDTGNELAVGILRLAAVVLGVLGVQWMFALRSLAFDLMEEAGWNH